MRRWERVKHVLACSCQSAAELSSRRMDERLPLVDQLALAGHLLVCHSCRHFNRQLNFLRRMSRALAAHVERFDEQSGLSDTARLRIVQAMRDGTK